MNLTRLQDACDSNALAALRHFGELSGGVVRDNAGAIMVASPDPYCGSYHNAVARVDPRADPRKMIDGAQLFFGKIDRKFLLWATEGRDTDIETEARRRGLILRGSGPGDAGMVATHVVAEPRPPDEIRLEAVETPADVAAFAHVVGQSFSARDESQEIASDSFVSAARTMFSNPRTLLSPMSHGVIAYASNAPVSCAMAIHVDRVAGLYWVSSLSTARRRGLGSLVAAKVVNDCFARRAEVVVLRASDMGARIYQRMGFVCIARHKRYLGSTRSGVTPTYSKPMPNVASADAYPR